MSVTNLSQAIFDRVSERILHWPLCRRASSRRILVRRIQGQPQPVREALQMLADRRLVEKTPRQGYVVRQLNLTEIHELYDLRLVLETYIMEQVCKTGMTRRSRRAQATLDQVYEALPEMIADPVTVDENFHQALARAVGNRAMVRCSQHRRADPIRTDVRHHQRRAPQGNLRATPRDPGGDQPARRRQAIDVLRRNIEAAASRPRTPSRSSRERPCDLRLTESGGPRRWIGRPARRISGARSQRLSRCLEP